MNSEAQYPQFHREIEEDPLYVMTVELEKGKSESIKIYPQSKPEELAYEFCKRHNLDFVSLDYLTNQIKSLLGNIVNQNQNQQTSISNANSECIIEEEEEENQTNDHRVTNEYNQYTNPQVEEINGNYESQMPNNPLRQEFNIIHNQNDEVSNEFTDGNQDEEYQITRDGLSSNQNNEQSINFSSKQFPDQKFVISYEDFFNRFKKRIEERDQLYLSTKTTNNRNKSKISNTQQLCSQDSNIEVMSIADNEKRFNEFLRKSNNLDDIYQNKRYSRNQCLSHDNKNIGNSYNTQIENLTGSFTHSKSQANSIDNNSNSFISLGYKAANKPQTSNLIKRRVNNWGNGLYESSLQLKPNQYKRINIFNQKLEHDADNDNAFSPVVNNRKANHFNLSTLTPIYNTYTTRNPKVSKTDYSYSGQHKRVYNKKLIKTSHYKHHYTLGNEDSKGDPITEILFNKKKEETFKKIFQLLDSDQDNCINILTMDTKRLPSTIYNIIKPIIYEIKNSNEAIEQSEFVRGCMKLFEVLPFNNRRALLDFSRKIRAN